MRESTKLNHAPHRPTLIYHPDKLPCCALVFVFPFLRHISQSQAGGLRDTLLTELINELKDLKFGFCTLNDFLEMARTLSATFANIRKVCAVHFSSCPLTVKMWNSLK